MEEQEKRKCEDPCEEQTGTHSLSVVLSVEEEAAEMPSDWGLYSADEDGVANGFGTEEGGVEGMSAAPGFSPSSGTTYWSVSEGPGFPLLLSPVAGPPARGGKTGKRRTERASRVGSSRIPGRDHRRYYHEYWRGEFLMDFDARQHRMLCMVCGSSLATLKLSTIKRHIQQKHPESLLWAAADKEAIRVGWDSHLRLQGAPGVAIAAAAHSPAGAMQSQEGALNSRPITSVKPEPGTSETPCGDGRPARSPSPAPVAPPPPASSATPPETREPSPDPPARVLERYVDDSLHAWFRQEFLMEYRADEGRLVCMVCAGQLPSLHLDHIKRHVLDGHPVSLLYSAKERHTILHSWAQKHESSPSREHPSVKPEPPPSDGGGSSEGAGDGGPGTARSSTSSSRSPGGRLPKRWRLGYLVARCPLRRGGVVCMVCSQPLPMANAGTFRQHIRQEHPETATLTRPERRALADAWSKRAGGAETTAGAPRKAPPAVKQEDDAAGREGGVGSGSRRTTATRGPSPGRGRVGGPPHAGRDQQRYYQARWRTEYLMEYDSLRHRLVCVVCSATLATLKVSTIKRHIQHVHPQTLAFGPAQREEALRNFSHPALALPPASATPMPASPPRTQDSPPGGAQEQD